MAWLGEGLSTLKGQISNFTKEVLSDGKEDGSGAADSTVLQDKVRDLESYCASQELEISELRERNQQLQTALNGGNEQGSAVEVAGNDDLQYVPTDSWSSWDQPGFQPLYGSAASKALPTSSEKGNIREERYLKDQVGHLEAENNLMKRMCSELEDQVAELSEQLRSTSSKDQHSKLLGTPDKNSPNASKELQLHEQLQASEVRVRDLESQLKEAQQQQQLLDQLNDSQESSRLIGSNLEQARKTQLTPNVHQHVMGHLETKQQSMHKIREVSLMREVAETNLKELQSRGKHVTNDIVSVIQKLGDHKQQELIHGALDAMELENQVLKLRNAELEMQAGSLKGFNLDLDIGYKVDHFGDDDSKSTPHSLSRGSNGRSTSLDGQIDHLEKHERSEYMNANWSAEKRILENQCHKLKAQLRETENNLNLAMAHKGLLEFQKEAGDENASASPNNELEALCTEKNKLLTEKQCLRTELEAMELTVQDLEVKMTTVLEENSALSSNLEELDQQHQLVIEQLLGAKKSVVKENETLLLELEILRKQLEEVPITNQCVDNGTDTCDLPLRNDVLYEEYKKTFDEEFSENIMQLVTFDLPQGHNSKSEELKSINLLKSLLKLCEESKWKKDTLERKVAEVMKEVRDTQKILTDRNQVIDELYQEVAALKANEDALVKELLEAKDNCGEGLASIPENSEEVEALEQRVASLEDQVRDKAMLEAEIRRLREERAVIARKFHIAEASLDNEENFQICTGHELQQALQSNGELQQENNTLLRRIHDLEIVEENQRELQERYSNLQELLSVRENELTEARKENSLLEIDIAKKLDCLQQALNANIELKEQNDANLFQIKSQEQLVEISNNFEKECSRLKTVIITKEEDLKKALDNARQLNSEFASLSDRYQEIMQAKSELEAEYTAIVSQVKIQDSSLKSNTDIFEEVSRLQEQLHVKQVELDEAVSRTCVLETDLATMTDSLKHFEQEKQSTAMIARDMEELLQIKLNLESEIIQWQEKYQLSKNIETSLRNEMLSLENTSQNLGIQLETALLERDKCIKQLQEKEAQCNGLLAAQSQTDEECVSLKSQLAAKSAEVESVLQAMSLIKQQNEDLIDTSVAAECESKRLEDQELMTQEVEKWKEIVSATERQLNEALQARTELEEECSRLFTIETKVHDQEGLQREMSRLTGVLEGTEQRLTNALEENAQLEEACMQLKVQLDDVKGLKQVVSEWKEKCSQIEHELQSAVGTNRSLEEECQRLSSEVIEMESTRCEVVQWKDMHEALQRQFDDLSCTKSSLEDQLANAHEKLKGLQNTKDELNEWKEKVQVIEGQLNEVLMKKLELEQDFNNREETFNNNEKMDQEKSHLDDKDVDESINGVENNGTVFTSGGDTTRLEANEQIEILQGERDQMVSILDEKTIENNSLKEENNHLMQILSAEKVTTNKLQEEKVETLSKYDMQSSETSLMAKETIANLSEIIKNKDIENEGLTEKCSSLVKLLKDVEDSSSKQLSRLMVERDELIRTVQLKHQESLQYHGEIQRLSGLLNQELGRNEQIRLQFEDKQKMLLNTQNELIAVKLRLDKLEQAAGTGVKTEQPFSAPTENTENEMKEPLSKKEYNQSLAEGTSTKIIALTSQETQDTVVQQLQAERSQLLDRVQQEATRNIYLQNEVQEQHEKEGALIRELERLRLHLVAVEESYTQEAVTTENQIRDLQGKLTASEERIKSCSTALTSASVRANQHVESLQGQTRLIGQQRDDVQAKLSAAEDQIQRHVAALTNLQAVLEQFQRDKDQEITAAKARLQRQLQVAEDRQVELLTEVSSLKSQLAEAKDGLSAATRLGEQLDRKTQVIVELKEEVNRLQGLLKTAEKREESASLNAEGKVDRYLVKNLLLGYLSAPANTKPQALRIIGTVLDFNLEERGRAGLEPGHSVSGSGGWLHSLLHPGTGTASGQSLSEAFIRFLESESRPQPQLRLLPTVQEQQQQQQQQNPQRGVSESPVPSGRSPILLTEVQLPTFTQFPVPRSSSSILKDVLKDS